MAPVPRYRYPLGRNSRFALLGVAGTHPQHLYHPGER
jgi:hypothetical protein